MYALQHLDPVGLLLTILFIASSLFLVSLDRWLNNQRARRRRNQAHQRFMRRKVGRW